MLAERASRRAPRVGLKGGRNRSYSLAERLAARTVRGEANSCWTFQGCHVGPNGYGQIVSSGSVRVYAHRAAWELANGRTVPDGLKVLHSCDNPRCVNPAHLSVGTQQDNIRDSVRKGRWTVRKVTDDQVAELRMLATAGVSRGFLAAKFGLSKSTVRHIIAGRQRAERIGEPLDFSIHNVEPVRTVDLPVYEVRDFLDTPCQFQQSGQSVR